MRVSTKPIAFSHAFVQNDSIYEREGGSISTPAKFELYKDAKGEFRGRLIASNGYRIANFGEGYKSKDGAKIGIESVKKNAASATIEDEA